MGVLGGVGLVYDERMCAHENLDDPLHPEQPARITSIFEALEGAGIVDRCERVEARDATLSELESVHTRDYIAKMCAVGKRKLSEKKQKELALRDSVYFNEGSSSSALLAAGSVVEVALRVARGDLKAGAAVVRPPGHHAEAGAAMGFCLFNNVAVAAHVLVHGNPDLGVRKVLIVDWDIHHGNGTQHMFWSDPQVLYFSVHRYDSGEFYPKGADGNYDKIGEASGAGFNINVPWPQGGFGDLDYLAVFDDVLIPVAQEFKPDLILVSGGFDSATGDPLGGCEVTPGGYSHMTKRLMGLANGRLVLALEGGYNLKSISESYLACVKVLLGDKPDLAVSTKHQMSYTTPLVKEIRRELQKYWLVLSTQDDAESITYVTEIPPNEVEEFSVPAYAAPVQGSDEVICLVEAFNKFVSLDPESNEVTAGCLVGKSLVETKEGNAEENSGLGGPQAAGTGEVSSSGSSEVGFSPVQEPRTSNQVAVETTGQTVIIGEHSQVNGMDGYADQQRLTQDAHVWYACYGSNLLLARFMCYIKGGQVAGMGKVCIGSRNQTPPVDSSWVMVPYHMFFGHSWTRTWQSGGVAFLDPIAHGGAPATHVRLYKITLQQFQDVLVQENGGDPYSSDLLFEWDHVNKLRDVQSASSHATLDILKEAWYGTVKYLGEEDGLPMLTVTCSTEHMQKFRNGHFKVCRPSKSYSRVILQGLLEQNTFSEEECKAYIASNSKGLPEDASAEKS